jgi:putative membrane protein
MRSSNEVTRPVALTKGEADAIEARVAPVEARTGAQVVAAVVAKSDVYVELPWKAFALGAALAGLVVVALGWARVEWVTARALMDTVVILGAGAASALAAIFVPAYARLFLRATRRESEVGHHARLLFLRHELFRTRGRNGILILVSRFERQVEVVADVGLRDRLQEKDWAGVIARMTPLLASSRVADALLAGLGAVEELLVARGLQGPPASGDELPDRPLEEAGER